MAKGGWTGSYTPGLPGGPIYLPLGYQLLTDTVTHRFDYGLPPLDRDIPAAMGIGRYLRHVRELFCARAYHICSPKDQLSQAPLQR